MINIKNNLKCFSNKNPGTILEDKTETVALHYRLSPKVETQALDLINQLISNQEDLELLIGKMVLTIQKKISFVKLLQETKVMVFEESSRNVELKQPQNTMKILNYLKTN